MFSRTFYVHTYRVDVTNPLYTIAPAIVHKSDTRTLGDAIVYYYRNTVYRLFNAPRLFNVYKRCMGGPIRTRDIIIVQTLSTAMYVLGNYCASIPIMEIALIGPCEIRSYSTIYIIYIYTLVVTFHGQKRAASQNKTHRVTAVGISEPVFPEPREHG